ncbi:MAG: sigma-70 family RNA polymerase sigma factor [Bacteroidetes bacterium]|nr:MAG: sigma-70 family RNA polymerase sigma factor [Bacteroidota bacterium]
MNCPDETVIELILDTGRRTEYQAVKCLRKCEPQTFGVLIRMSLRDENERRSIFNLALAEFILQVRQGKFILTGAAKICTYVTEIARRKWLELSRKQKQDPVDLPDEVPVMPDTSEVDEAYQARVYAALKRLKPSDQEILVAFYFFDIPLDEFAARKKMSHEAAKKRISRARERLKEILKPNNP